MPSDAVSRPAVARAIPLLAIFALLVVDVGCKDSGTMPRADVVLGDGDGDAAGEERIDIPGLSAPVTVYIDASGFVHISCKTDDDCFAAQGYVDASHRFFQMDLRRRLARGRISEIAGSIALDSDVQHRLLYATRGGEPAEQALFDNSNAETKAAFVAYTRGVNAWLADLRAGRHGAKAARERQFPLLDGTRFDDWTELDSIASVFLLIDSLINFSRSEIVNAERYNALGADVAGDLISMRPVSPGTLMPTSGLSTTPVPVTITPAHAQLLLKAKPLFDVYLGRVSTTSGNFPGHGGQSAGSNNWAIAPSRSGGKTLIAGDPHLPLSNPAVWHVVHLDSKTDGTGSIHVAGLSFPGLPGVIFGHNEDVAWTVTNTEADSTDVYVETLSSDGAGVMYNGSKVAFVKRDETFKIKDAADVTRTLLYVPHHGPVIAGPEPSLGLALSLRWTLADADTDANMILALMKAKSVAEARDALRNVTALAQNWVVADRSGSIGWFPYNRWHSRPFAKTYPPWLPLPGTGEAEWGAVVPYDQLPQLVDPKSGYIVTANNDFTGAMADGNPLNDDAKVMQWFVAIGFRRQRIVERIEARATHDLASMQSIQNDASSLLGKRVMPALLASADKAQNLSAGGQALVAALKAWDFECPTGLDGTDFKASPATKDPTVLASAIGCTAFHVLWVKLLGRTFNDELRAAKIPTGVAHNPLVFALTETDPFGGRSYWDDVSTSVVETRDDIIAGAIEASAAYLVKTLGADPAGWLWGRIHTLSLRADLFGELAGGAVKTYDGPEQANDGGYSTVDNASPSGRGTYGYGNLWGSSVRFACEADVATPFKCTVALPGGQVHHRDDPHYLDLLDDYLSNKQHALAFDIAKVKASAPQTLQLVAP